MIKFRCTIGERETYHAIRTTGFRQQIEARDRARKTDLPGVFYQAFQPASHLVGIEAQETQ